MKKLFFILSLCITFYSAHGQKAYIAYNNDTCVVFGTIDIQTGKVTNISKLKTIRSIFSYRVSFDIKDNLFFLTGYGFLDSYTNMYAIDAATGTIKYHYIDSVRHLANFNYDNRKNILYVKGDSMFTMKADFTGLTPIGKVNNITFESCGGIEDEEDGKLIANVSHDSSKFGLLVENINKPAEHYYLNQDVNAIKLGQFQYDTVSDKLYGLYFYLDSARFLVKFGYQDITTGAITNLSTLPDAGITYCTDAIDEADGLYTYLNSNLDSAYYELHTLSLKTGELLYNVPLHLPGIQDPYPMVFARQFGDGSNRLVNGHVFTSQGKPLIHSWMYMVSHNKDSSINILDSMFTDSTGSYGFRTADSLVYLYASPDSAIYPREFPTWYDTAVYFNASASIPVNMNIVTHNWKTVAGTNPGGSGSISGTVYKCTACKHGDPVAGLKLILANSGNQPVAFTFTDKNGNFTFRNVALGKYKFWADKPSISNKKVSTELTLSASNPAWSNVILTLYPDHLEYTTNGISNINQPPFHLYPNPASGIIHLLNDNASSSYTVSIKDITGKLRKEMVISEQGDIAISVSDLAAGIYLMQVKTAQGISALKFVKE
jgi:hypothetical protein